MITLDGIELPIDLIWDNEYQWSNVTQTVKKSLTGSLVVQEAYQPKGRIIRLRGDENSTWITKATLDLLKAKYDTPDLIMVLSYFGTNYNVMFNRSNPNDSALEVTPIYDLRDPQADHIYTINLNFIEV